MLDTRRSLDGFLLVALTTAVALAIAPHRASGAPTPATIDKSKVELSEASGGGWTTTVGITNLTDAGLEATTPALSANCKPSVGDGTAEIPPAERIDLTISIPSTCKADDGLSLTLVTSGKGVSHSFSVMASPATPKPRPDWSSLWSFFWTLIASVVVVGVVFSLWRWRTRAEAKGLLASLTGLDTTWSFKDSIVSNLTAAGGLVAVVLGSSDVLKSVLGEKAEAAIAVATVAGAIALALLGAAGVLVITVKWPTEKDVSIAGLCAGTAVALGAAGGQVWTITILSTSLSLGPWAEGSVWFGCIAASVLLIGYAWTSVYGLLTQGTTPAEEKDPLADPLSPEVVAAAVIAAALPDAQGVTHPVTHARVMNLLKQLEPRQDRGKPQERERPRHIARPRAFSLAERSALP